MNDEIIRELKDSIRNVPDFPKEGILFKDITTMLKDPIKFGKVADSIYEMYKNQGITKVVGIESRGFIMGSVLAYKLGAGFVPIRKPGKLPYNSFKTSYELEYGTDCIEIHVDALSKDDVVLLHDDLLATGGSANAAISLLSNFEVKNIYLNFIIELEFLDGRTKFGSDANITSLLKF